MKMALLQSRITWLKFMEGQCFMMKFTFKSICDNVCFPFQLVNAFDVYHFKFICLFSILLSREDKLFGLNSIRNLDICLNGGTLFEDNLFFYYVPLDRTDFPPQWFYNDKFSFFKRYLSHLVLMSKAMTYVSPNLPRAGVTQIFHPHFPVVSCSPFYLSEILPHCTIVFSGKNELLPLE